mmetsp:Transcript_5438/g.8196  ORF Transcript_5438/g.8196 Transcript_5438/m.8196 type:complete len:145 (-) Transcript_5438:178-612(-)
MSGGYGGDMSMAGGYGAQAQGQYSQPPQQMMYNPAAAGTSYQQQPSTFGTYVDPTQQYQQQPTYAQGNMGMGVVAGSSGQQYGAAYMPQGYGETPVPQTAVEDPVAKVAKELMGMGYDMPTANTAAAAGFGTMDGAMNWLRTKG